MNSLFLFLLEALNNIEYCKFKIVSLSEKSGRFTKGNELNRGLGFSRIDKARDDQDPEISQTCLDKIGDPERSNHKVIESIR